LAAAISAFIPPPAAADEAVAQLPPLDDAPAAALPEEPELLHPAASMIDPTAAQVATIAFDARKVKPSHARPQGVQGEQAIASWLDKPHLGQIG
jgi:hypothetical protein